jgi:phosphatidate cytidylyltransferase
LAKRLLTAGVGIPAVAALVHAGGPVFLAAVIFLAAAALLELNKMAARKNLGIYFFAGALPVFFLCLAAYFWGGRQLDSLVALAVLAILGEGVLRHKEDGCFYKSCFTLLAFCYIGIFFSRLILLRNLWPNDALDTFFGRMPAGEAVFWVTLAGVWASDTFAYFVGTAFGRVKLCPAISPGKSWEGALGGFLGCVAAVWILGGHVFGLEGFAPLGPGLLGATGKGINLPLLGALIGIFAPLGDLAESWLKRFFGVKDSGALFPGHGGALDRLDSLLFAAPAVFAYLSL